MRYILLLALTILMSCAGPSSPFGSDLFISEEFIVTENRSLAGQNIVSIQGQPAVKLYHTPYDLKIKLESESSFDETFRYDIIYNNRKINRWWQSESIQITPDRKQALIEFKSLSLMPGVKNNITFLFYPNITASPLVYTFKDPECHLNYYSPISKINKFDNGMAYTEKINTASGLYNVNSFLLASLVAQESSFNPKAVSWAKAMGLTQVTPLANTDIKKIKTDWKSYPNINRMSYARLKYNILRGHINQKNDWRLDASKSLEGGALFLKEIQDYWEQKENKDFLAKTFKEIPYTDIVLASYNSGSTRVKRNLTKKKKNWLWAKELKEARKYVMNIKSYCHHFQHKR